MLTSSCDRLQPVFLSLISEKPFIRLASQSWADTFHFNEHKARYISHDIVVEVKVRSELKHTTVSGCLVALLRHQIRSGIHHVQI